MVCRGRDGGQALPLVVVGAVAVAVGALVLAHLAGRAQSMAQAQTAADAAALAAAGGGPASARQLAAANGGVLETYAMAAGTVQVEVTVAGERAVAAATPRTSGVSPALAAALDRVVDILGESVLDSMRLVGPSGSGGVEFGRHVASRLGAASHRTGLCRAGGGRPLHFVLCPAIRR